MRKLPLATFIVAALLVASLARTARATDWLQFGSDEQHSSYNTQETGYSTAGNSTLINGISIKTPGASPATKSVDSAPILATGVATANGIRDVLYFTAKDGTLLALDATTGLAIWSQTPTAVVSSPSPPPVLGSPLLDAAKQFVYSYGLDGFVHKYAAASGAEAAAGWPVESTKKPEVDKSAASLSRVTENGITYLYSVHDGPYGDGYDYQGHLTAINVADATYKVFNANCSDLTYHFNNGGATTGTNPPDCAVKQSGIWGRPGTTYDAVTHRLFITVANGPFDPTGTKNNKGITWGDSILALHADGTGSATPGFPVDSYTPQGADEMQHSDADLGAESMAILVPGKIGLQASKDACVRLINIADMSGLGSAGNKGGELAAYKFFTMGTNNCTSGSDAKNGGSEDDELKPQPAVWKNPADQSVWVFVSNYTKGLAAYQLDATNPSAPTLTQKWTAAGGSSAVVANGTLYYIADNNGTFNVVALDAATGNATWTSPALGSMHWQSPIVANGHIYTADGSSHVWAFALDGIFRNKFDGS